LYVFGSGAGYYLHIKRTTIPSIIISPLTMAPEKKKSLDENEKQT
jgi:hypothetical protein